jgi:hypothetical protein
LIGNDRHDRVVTVLDHRLCGGKLAIVAEWSGFLIDDQPVSMLIR